MKFNDLNEGYSVLPNIDTDRYGDRSGEGLEGPFRAGNGKVVYYDAKAGMYYDPDTDFYLSYDEWKEMNESVTEGAIKVKSTDLHDLVVQMVQDIDYNETKKLADIARALGKEVFYQNDKVVLQDPDFDYNAETVQEADQDWDRMSKREFKRAELQQELGHEDEWEKQRRAQQKPQLQYMMFYNVPEDKASVANSMGIKQTKSGRWAIGVYNTSGSRTDQNIRKANTAFGPGKKWTPKPKNESVNENSAMEKAIKSIEMTFSPERKAQQEPITRAVRAAAMQQDKKFAQRGLEMAGVANIEELRTQLEKLKAQEEKLVGHEYIVGADMNVRGIDSALEKLNNMNESTALTEEQFDEAAGEKDACYHKVKSRYKVWPSAYASGALVKCRKVGAKNWGNKK